jgi:hypothetical protein
MHGMCGSVWYTAATGTVEAPALVPLVRELIEVRGALLADHDPRTAAVMRVVLSWANGLTPAGHQEARGLIGAEAARVLRHYAAHCPVDLAEAMVMEAATAIAEGRSDDARRRGREAWHLLEGALEGDMWFSAAGAVRASRTLIALELFEEAESVLLSAHEILCTQIGAEGPDARAARRVLVDLYTAWEKPIEAAKFVELEETERRRDEETK